MKKFPAFLILSAALVFAWSAYAAYRSDSRIQTDKRLEEMHRELDFLLLHYRVALAQCHVGEPDIYHWFAEPDAGTDL